MKIESDCNKLVLEVEMSSSNKERGSVAEEDIEEGEISDDSQSVEEISAEDFKQQQERENCVSSSKTVASSSSMVWMGDLLKYRGSSNYGSGLYNFAWAQAVQNKPLSEGLVSRQDIEQQLANNKREKAAAAGEIAKTKMVSSSSSSAKEQRLVCNIILDDSSDEEIALNKSEDKEEGELEEGEIDFDSDPTATANSTINSIKQTLDTLTVNHTNKSFDEACLRLQTSLHSLHSIVCEAAGPLLDQAFAAIRTVKSVFNSMDFNQQQHMKDNYSRLLAHVNNQVPALFSPEQMKEIQAARNALDSPTNSSLDVDMEIDEDDVPVKKVLGILGEKPALVESGILGEKPGKAVKSFDKGLLQPFPIKPVDQRNTTIGSETLKQGVLGFSRGRGNFGPLLDLHRDHDVDSLPSPTREAPPPVYMRERQVIGVENVKAESKPMVESKIENVSVHRYETDAVKAVSTYQQKFGRNSFLLSSRLPSPTPSEESEGADSDLTGEVSSLSSVGYVKAVDPPMPLQTFYLDSSHINKSSGHALSQATITGPVASGPNPQRVLSKSRDPRLRIGNSEMGPSDVNAHPLLRDAPKIEPVVEIVNSTKDKNIGETTMDGPVLKKQKSGSTDVQMFRGGGWLENCSTVGKPAIDKIQSSESMVIDTKKAENVGIFSGQRQVTPSTLSAKTSETEQLPAIVTTNTATLPSLLKDIAVNPSLLMQLIMEQQRLAAESQKSSYSMQGEAPSFNVTSGSSALGNVALTRSYDYEQKPEKPQNLSQTALVNPQDEAGKIRMKPRDPRRILHSSTFQKNECLGSEHFKTNGSPMLASEVSRNNVSVRPQSEQAQTSSISPEVTSPPDIARQFTTNLKNLADIISSQSTDSVSTVSQSLTSSQAISVWAEKSDLVASATHSKDQQSGNSPESVTDTSRPKNAWGDIEHLFERYDDKQKAAIQRERTRRIEEQNKMFATKKLCLVLDLDHTLLNSAKFNEVEPVHEEILRKKEEQDREKPQRHLFRFSHMGMWTKLRPGIWSFLEKASKLYELHLYTMGNKLYATEMAKVLDPTGVLFAGRVISKGDDEDPFDGDEKIPKSKDLEGVLGMESAVVIIDDSIKVWPHNKLNLILVERYTYFPCSRRQFGLPGPSLLEIDHDERPEDGTLASSLSVIERIHQNFFSNLSLHEVDVRNILAAEQRKILAGCRILFSRIFPVGETKPHQHPLWQTAEQFGAVCTTQIDDMVTHVVANSLGTDKVNWAMSTRRFVVHPGWVEASALLYRRANENDFAVKINLP